LFYVVQKLFIESLPRSMGVIPAYLGIIIFIVDLSVLAHIRQVKRKDPTARITFKELLRPIGDALDTIGRLSRPLTLAWLLVALSLALAYGVLYGPTVYA